jgi:glycosyltransferase involved in cell wall biosynthesis/GT2 family glycosyltransferase
MTYPQETRVYDGVDWWWGPSLLRALRFMRAQRADVVVLQWWTAAVFHTYLVLVIAARLNRSRVVLEVHEVQDPGEAQLGPARAYGRTGLRLLLRLSHGCLAHSDVDLRNLQSGFLPSGIRTAVAPHGPFDHYALENSPPPVKSIVTEAPRPSAINILYFGVIRPYKGLEDLVRIFNDLPEQEAERFWLTVVGETWEGWTEPARLIASSRHRARISFVNEYVTDEVVKAAFAHADIVVLPYRRSSSSGPLHIAMGCGLPVVITSVGGLPEAAGDYEGAVFVPPGDLAALKDGIMRASCMLGKRYQDRRNWSDTIQALHAAAGGTSELTSSSPGRDFASAGIRAAAAEPARSSGRALGMSQASDPDERHPASAVPVPNGAGPLPTVSVVIAAYTERRWACLQRAIASVQSQSIRPAEAILVIDHNPELLARAQAELPYVRVIPNTRAAGSSGARNTGAAASQGDILVFLDDDIVAGDGWLETVLTHFSRPEVVGVGGQATPLWQEARPVWFPPEFYWVVGASYVGMLEHVGPVRNIWSSNMAVRRGIFESAGGFRDHLAKIADKSRPDDTDLCLRAAEQTSGQWIYDPRALASHWIPSERASFKYFLYRCFHEGVGKGALTALNGLRASTSVESRYIGVVLPSALLRDCKSVLTGHLSTASRIAAVGLGLSAAVAGFLMGVGKYYLLLGRVRRFG